MAKEDNMPLVTTTEMKNHQTYNTEQIHKHGKIHWE